MRLRMLSMFAMLFVLCAGAALAQTTSGSITGTVVDPQQSAVANATVTVTEEGKTYSLTATTDGEGRFVFPIVPPGTYTMIVEAAGFKKQERKGITLVANDRLALGNLSLEVGAVTETIVVTGEATPIQADSGERSFAIQGEQIRNVGVKTRSYINLATLAPGVVASGAGDGSSSSTTGLSVNGARLNSNNVQIDGITSVDTGNNSELSRIPLDAVGEFKLLTSTYQPEYGRSSGAQFIATTRSGSQDFHGSVYYYRRHTGLNANTFDNNRNNRPRPISDQEDKGYSIGGPVYIPGFFNADKKKLFFFLNQEFTPRINPNGLNRVRVPTALERAGDFSQSRNSSGTIFPFIRDYTLNLPCTAANTTGCFADGGVVGRIPASRFYSLGQRILNLYPLPNHTEVGTENFNFTDQISDTIKERNDTVRIDYNFNENWRVYGRVLNNSNSSLRPYAGLGFILGGNIAQYGFKNNTPRLSYAGTVNGTLSPTVVVEFTYGFSRNTIEARTESGTYTRTATGLTGLPLIFPNAVQEDLLSQFGYGGRLANTPSYRVGNGPFLNSNRTDDFSGSLSKIWRSHVIKAGGIYERANKQQTNRVLFNGGISFSDTANNPFDTQQGFSNALTGVYANFTQASASTNGQYKYKNLEWFVQDNWKITDRLTLDYGMRFSWLPPTFDESGAASNFDPTQYRLSAAPRLYVPVCINGAATCTGGSQTSNRRAVDPAVLASGVPLTLANTLLDTVFVGRIVPNSGSLSNGLSLAGTNGIPERLIQGQGILFAPRLGFAYDLTGNHNLILRGGFGIFYDRPQGNLVFDFNENAPTTITSILDFGLLQTLTSSIATSTVNPPNVKAIEFDAKNPSTNSYNIGIQYKLPFDAVLDVAYVGSQGHHLPHSRSINSTPFGSAFLPANQDPTKALNPTVPGSNALPFNLYRPFKGFGDISLTEFNENSNYHSVQISGNRRFSKGLLLSANYTWSLARGVSTNDQDGARIDGNKDIDYGRLGFDRTHNFVINWVYELPDPTKNRYLGFIANGWQLSGIYRFQSGEPELVSCGVTGFGTVNLTGSSSGNSPRCVLIGDPKAVASKDDFHLFNIAAFQAPRVGSMGLETRRDDLLVNAPPINNVDLSLSKKFFFWERMRVEVRLDAFNALNHTQVAFMNFFGGNFTAPGSSTLVSGNAANPLTNRTGFGAAFGYRPNRTMQWMLRFEF